MNHNLSLLLTGFMLIAGIVRAATEPVQILLLAGQSNMAGHGTFDDLSDVDKTRITLASERVLVSTDGGPAAPLSFLNAEQHVNEFGPEVFLGVTLAETYPDRKYLFIKTAVGGTSLHGAWSPNWTAEKANLSEFGEARKKMKLYSAHHQSIKDNLQSLTQQGKSYEIIGMAWMQGEKDTRLEPSAVHYEGNLRTLINAYRAAMNRPDLPFVFGQINNPFRGKNDYPLGTQTVRAAMVKVAESVPHTAMIATSTDPSWNDFPKRDDQVHYTAEGQKRLGTAMANALIHQSN